MRGTEIYKYFAFGYNYGLIRQNGLSGDERIQALGLLDNFFSFLSSLDLQVTQTIAKELQNITDSLRKSSEVHVSSDLAEKIANQINKIDPALDAELQIKKAYILTKKRYPLDTLMMCPEELLGEGVLHTLSVSAKKDYELACVQICLSQPTAAAFHLMRALEEQVRVLYFSFKKTKRMDQPMWGPIIRELRSKRSPKPSQKLLDHLDGMRVHFRNPTQHPELFYSMDDAQDLLNQTITAMNMIATEIPIAGKKLKA